MGVVTIALRRLFVNQAKIQHAVIVLRLITHICVLKLKQMLPFVDQDRMGSLVDRMSVQELALEDCSLTGCGFIGLNNRLFFHLRTIKIFAWTVSKIALP